MDTDDLNTNEHIHSAEGGDMPPASNLDTEISPDTTASGTAEMPPEILPHMQPIENENADTAGRQSAERQTAAQNADTVQASPSLHTGKKRKKSGFFKKAGIFLLVLILIILIPLVGLIGYALINRTFLIFALFTEAPPTRIAAAAKKPV